MFIQERNQEFGIDGSRIYAFVIEGLYVLDCGLTSKILEFHDIGVGVGDYVVRCVYCEQIIYGFAVCRNFLSLT